MTTMITPISDTRRLLAAPPSPLLLPAWAGSGKRVVAAERHIAHVPGFVFWTTVSADYIWDGMPDVPVLITATSFWRKSKRWYGEIPAANLPAHLRNIGVDAGGFVATRILGDYPFTLPQYVRWLELVKPLWAATMDYCCEDEITLGKPSVVRQRQQRTTDMAWLAWLAYRDVSWRWMPTIQGWAIEDYQWHARQMKPLIKDMQRHYGRVFVVGIGTLCKRASAEMIRDVVRAVSWELPGVRFHLWGIKFATIEGGLPACVASTDSAAWHTLGSYAGHRANYRAAKATDGTTKRQYEWNNALPVYLQRVENARPQDTSQLPLFAP